LIKQSKQKWAICPFLLAFLRSADRKAARIKSRIRRKLKAERIL
jgi:hypothetical protein